MAAMFQRSKNVPLAERSIGVLVRNESKMQSGYTLLHVNKESYLLDEDGRVVHEWSSCRDVFCGKLRPNGNLVRDGSDTLFTPAFRTGGAAGYVEEVSWSGDVVWRHTFLPSERFLTHHDIELLPNGNVLVLGWEKVSVSVNLVRVIFGIGLYNKTRINLCTSSVIFMCSSALNCHRD